MVAAYYIIGAALAAWLAHGRLDWKLSLLVLPLMILAHSCYKAIAGRHGRNRFGTSPHPACAKCGNEIGMFRRLARHHFCCDEHERTYWIEMDKIAILRLHNARLAAPLASPQEIVPPGGDNSNVADHEVVPPILGQREPEPPLYRRPKSSRSQAGARIPRRDVVTNVWRFARMFSATSNYAPTPETTSHDLP
jgi:hypothetical protein